ncbi:MAG: hypothetical protein UT24_C0029G0041 [Candidatus Woesebacteria bacterium GW2011_GWB1_39_12]|uniref:Prohead serine protease domain-containing protein n=1 Tax=Candidatus Woesebacteria bacterium GW2011_GWB1_39_12 TaxID=1618574 RepID=A0A0G0PLL2_9BACT|nr:MAG: hypothetical protein UT24_C0029G0041 [Candidatus Woesebacteria bacterium GW2011_GWB1_39_12]
MDDIKIFVGFTKKDNEKREVHGYASSETLDSQGEVVEKEAIIKALPGYLGDPDPETGKFRFGGLREMHQPSAVGKTVHAKVDNKGLFIKGKVVDKDAWEKVKEGVYTGFSIGGKVLEQVKNRIKAIKLSEISLVDRPANPDALFSMVKIDDKGKITEGQVDKNMIISPMTESSGMDPINTAGFILSLAKDIRYLLYSFEQEGKSLVELNKVLDLLKKLAVKVLSEEDKKKFDNILYGMDNEELMKGTLDEFEKKKLKSKEREAMASGQFAYVDSKGGKHLPISDKAHVQNAMARFNQTHFESSEKKKSAARKILAAAKRLNMEIDSKSAVVSAAKLDEDFDIKKFVDYNWTPGYFENMRKVLG